MTVGSPPIIKDLVLIGGGHSHVEVIKRFGMNGLPGMRLTVICRDVHTPYSGMLPGLVAGHYRFDEAHIDLGPLCRFAGARFYHDEAVGLDLANQLVSCRDRPLVPYDVLSINIGSAPDIAAVPGAATHAVAVKPISRFIVHWEALCARVLAAPGPVRIGVVGTGAGGVEMVLAMQYRLRALLAAAGRTDDHLAYTLFGRADHVLPSHPVSVQRRFARVLHDRGIRTITGQPIVAVEQGHLRRADGTCHDLGEMLFVTSARAAPWLRDSGLALDPEGFVEVGAALQSTSHPNVFAAGDIAAVIGHERPKSGVFAVRQGPPLAANLRRAIVGEALRDFHPQRDALSLISTGDAYAVASRGRWSVEGRSIWCWKDWIDRRFMRKYNELPIVPTAAPTTYAAGLGDEAA